MDKTSLIYKVLSGKASSDEKKQLDHWIALDDANKSEFNDIKLLLENPDDTVDFPVDGFQRIQKQIKSLTKKRKTTRRIGGVLTAAILVLILSYIFQVQIKEKKNAYLRFDQTPITTVIQSLEEHYAISIDVGEGITSCHVTGTFVRGLPKDVLQHIAESLSLEVVVVGRDKFKILGTCSTSQDEGETKL